MIGALAAASLTIAPLNAPPKSVCAGGGGLDVLRAAGDVADPLELDVAEVAEVGGEFGEGDLADRALVAQLAGLPAAGCGVGAAAGGGGEDDQGGSGGEGTQTA